MSNRVQNKMLPYEVTPPSGVWNKIAAELDESELEHAFPSTLYTAEVNPPLSTWNKIQMTLRGEHEEAFKNQKRLWLRYAAAAVVIGLVTWGGVQLMDTKSANKEVAEIRTTPAVQEDIDLSPDTSPTNQISKTSVAASTVDPEEARNDAALEASKKTFAKLELPVNNSRLRNIASSYRFALGGETDAYAEITYQTEACSSDNTDRYIMIMKPEGNIVRISKKFSHLVCCVSAENEDKDCKDQMTKWRQKIACSPTGHSSGSFFDILSLVDSLQDQ